jgi:hypothetical protein
MKIGWLRLEDHTDEQVQNGENEEASETDTVIICYHSGSGSSTVEDIPPWTLPRGSTQNQQVLAKSHLFVCG